jgi:EmrB/QacA subfamily drug resistance transporter
MSGHGEPVAVRPRAILTVLGLGTIAYVLLQSLVVPALPTIQRDLGASTSGAAWIFTSFLIAASIATPIAGRLGDMFGKRRVLIIVLVCLALGTGMAAVVTTLPLMIVARTIQGIGGAILPLSFGIARDEFPRERVAGAIALISGLLGVGGGLGIVLAGPILENLSWHWLFWIPCGASLVTVVAALFLVPESPVRAPGQIHWLGALLLSGTLVCLMLAISEATRWGVGSGKTLGLLGVAAVLGFLWVRAELAVTHPLVDMAMMRLRGVWTTNLAGLLVGLGMFSAFVLIAQYVQAPESTGYGFGASVTQAGLFVLPSPVMVMVASPIAGRLTRTVGPKVPLVLGAAIDVIGFAVLAVASAPVWIYLASGITGFGAGFAFAAMANLIVAAVRPDQTAVASGMNTIVRTIGSATGAALAASVLSANLLPSGYPDRHGYTVIFTLCAVIMAVGLGVSLLVPGRPRVARANVPEGASVAEG